MYHPQYLSQIREYANKYNKNYREIVRNFEKGFEKEAEEHKKDLANCSGDPDEYISNIVFAHWDESGENFLEYYEKLSVLEHQIKADNNYEKQFWITVLIADKPVNVYTVNGVNVRKEHIEFIQGGHHIARPDLNFIPEGEIWVETMLEGPDDMLPILLHEAIEYELMNEMGWEYSEAHEKANEFEDTFRNDKKVNSSYTSIKIKWYGTTTWLSYPVLLDRKFEGIRRVHQFSDKYELEMMPVKKDLKEVLESLQASGQTVSEFPESVMGMKLTEQSLRDLSEELTDLQRDLSTIQQFEAGKLNTSELKQNCMYDVSEKQNIIEAIDILQRYKAKKWDKDVEMKQGGHIGPRKSVSDIVKAFMPVEQVKMVNQFLKGEEAQYFSSVISDFEKIIEKIPTHKQTQKIPLVEKIIHLHYFSSGSDWFIAEKDPDASINDAWGYAILNGDLQNAEWGYISIPELIADPYMQLEFDYEPKPFKQAMEEKGYGKKPERKSGAGTGKSSGEPPTDSMSPLDMWVDFIDEGYPTGTRPSSKRLFQFKNREQWEKAFQIMHQYGNYTGLNETTLSFAIIIRNDEESKNRIEQIYQEITGLMDKKQTMSTKQGEHFKGFEHEYQNPYELNLAIQEFLDLTRERKETEFGQDERNFIARYTGMGGLQDFGADGPGILYEYYTPEPIIDTMWGLAYKYGFKPGQTVLEPSVGIGRFLRKLPTVTDANNLYLHTGQAEDLGKGFPYYVAIEPNKDAARICQILYPHVEVINGVFEQQFIIQNKSVGAKHQNMRKYNLVITNPPYGSFQGYYAGMGEKTYTKASNYIEYFIYRGLDSLLPGGLLIYVVGVEVAAGGLPFLASGDTLCKKAIAEKGILLDAYRLPTGVFDRTDVTTDIIVMQKK